jgi:hypothetical protein
MKSPPGASVDLCANPVTIMAQPRSFGIVAGTRGPVKKRRSIPTRLSDMPQSLPCACRKEAAIPLQRARGDKTPGEIFSCVIKDISDPSFLSNDTVIQASGSWAHFY